MGATYTYNKFFSCHRQSFRAPFGEGAAIKGLTHMRSMCVGVAETGLGGRGEVCTLTKSGHFASLLQWGIDRFAQANAVGVAETGAEGGPR